FELVISSELRRQRLVNFGACEKLNNSSTVSQHTFFTPVEKISHVILTNLQILHKRKEGDLVFFHPGLPTRERLRAQMFLLGILSKLLVEGRHGMPRHSRESGNPIFFSWIPGERSETRNDRLPSSLSLSFSQYASANRRYFSPSFPRFCAP